MKDVKYLFAYIVPILTYIAIDNKGLWSYSSFVFAFGIVPLLDTFGGTNSENDSPQVQSSKLNNVFFDVLLYINVPLLYGILGYFIHQLHTAELHTYETIGLILSTGTMMGSLGINIAHELGHKKELHKRVMGQLLLLPSLYMHFTMEHNLGHHKNVATPDDPATAKRGQSIYFFWIKSIIGTYVNAWRLQSRLLQKEQKSFFSLANKQLLAAAIQILFLSSLFIWGGAKLLFLSICTALFSVLLLETINYIEHYGLQRRKLESGRYERVKPMHSWNSDHQIGRILLYELTRHSDHHYMAHKKYQVLESHREAKQLPFGYPACMLLSLVPPVWFRVMHKRI